MVFIMTFSDVRTLNFKTAAIFAFLGAVAIANFIEREWVQKIVFKHFCGNNLGDFLTKFVFPHHYSPSVVTG